MVENGMDDPNMSVYHMMTLTKVFVEFGGCALVLKKTFNHILGQFSMVSKPFVFEIFVVK
jgi:hypothetical protein